MSIFIVPKVANEMIVQKEEQRNKHATMPSADDTKHTHAYAHTRHDKRLMAHMTE